MQANGPLCSSCSEDKIRGLVNIGCVWPAGHSHSTLSLECSNDLLEKTWRSELWVREGVGGGLVEEPSAAQRFVGAPAAEVGRLTN